MDELTKEKLINSLKDVHGFVSMQIPIWLIVPLILVIAAVIVYIYLKNKKKDESDIRPLNEKIIEKLKELEQVSDSKVFYEKYSELLKSYLDFRFSISILDKTTKEIETVLTKIKNLETSSSHNLIKCLERADLAKFAKKSFSGEDKLEDLSKSLEIIQIIESQFIIETDEEEEDL